MVIWTQGCSKACKNCFNPETWSNKKHLQLSPEQIFNYIKENMPDGVTLTGGDPLEQPQELLVLLRLIDTLNLPKGIIVFTGYTIDELYILGNDYVKCLDYIDLLIDGRFVDSLKCKNGLRGSINQNFHYLSDKLKQDEIEIDQKIEIGFINDKIYVTGFPDTKIYLKKFGVKFN